MVDRKLICEDRPDASRVKKPTTTNKQRVTFSAASLQNSKCTKGALQNRHNPKANVYSKHIIITHFLKKTLKQMTMLFCATVTHVADYRI